MISMNVKAYEIARQIEKESESINVSVMKLACGATVLDAGINVCGSHEAGCLFSEICLGGLGRVHLCDINLSGISLPGINVDVNQPTRSCMGSQYAGWALKVKGKDKADNYFAMGSGPARALYAKEDIFGDIDCKEDADVAVLTLESRKIPDERVARHVAEKCKVAPDRVYLLVAPTASLVGSVQVAARVVETGLHKMREVGFDIRTVVSGFGVCPSASIAENDLKAIGRTNDAVLYGGKAWYTVKTDDELIEKVIDQLPSSASEDYGVSFYELFQRYDGDFYKMDPLLFSPAEVSINNMVSGRTFQAGRIDRNLVEKIILKL